MNSSRVAASALRNEQAATLLEFMYHSRIVLSVGGSVCYMIRNIRCTVTIDSVLANSKTKNAFLFTVNANFSHDYPLAVEPGSTPRPLAQKELGDILYLLIYSFLPCLSWLLRSRVRKSRRDLWITLYTFSTHTHYKQTYVLGRMTWRDEHPLIVPNSKLGPNLQVLRRFLCWDCWFEFCRIHGCLSHVIFVWQADHSCRGVLPNVVCLSVIEEH